MKNSKLIRGLAALAVCALVLPVVGSSKNPVERPLKMSGIVLENTGSSMDVVGTATHLGKFASKAYWEYRFYDRRSSRLGEFYSCQWGYFGG